MRIAPTSVDFSDLKVFEGSNTNVVSAATLNRSTELIIGIDFTVAATAGVTRPYSLLSNSATGYLGVSSEL
jgi:hypothetical protein